MWFADISQVLTIIVIQLLRHVVFVCMCAGWLRVQNGCSNFRISCSWLEL